MRLILLQSMTGERTFLLIFDVELVKEINFMRKQFFLQCVVIKVTFSNEFSYSGPKRKEKQMQFLKPNEFLKVCTFYSELKYHNVS